MPSSNDPNEAVPVIEYIVGEMNRNAGGQDARRIRDLNSYSGTDCIAEWQRQSIWRQLLTSGMPQQCMDTEMSSRNAALLSWGLNVRQDGPWDHKPIIRRRFNPMNPAAEQAWHRLGNFDYFYDIWSNIHYGYVGKACAFSDSMLLDGAGLEQVGSDLVRRRLPQQRPGVAGMRSFDDPSDQASIRIGIDLYRTSPGSVNVQQVRTTVEANSSLTKRPLQLAAGRRS